MGKPKAGPCAERCFADPAGRRRFPCRVALDPAGRKLLGELECSAARRSTFRSTSSGIATKQTATLARFPANWSHKRQEELANRHAVKKPQHIAFYGSFGRGGSDYTIALKDALGLQHAASLSHFETLPVDGYHQHLRNEDQIRKYAENLGADRGRFRVCSFGDEISLGRINFERSTNTSNRSAPG